MEDDIPVKKRKLDRQNESVDVLGSNVAGNLEVSPLSVKPDKIQKLRKITATCESRMQNTKGGDIIISSVGSSPSTSPCPENLTSLSTPVDPAELKERLTTLVSQKHAGASDVGFPGVQASAAKDAVRTETNEKKDSEGKVFSPSLEDVGETESIPSGNVKIPMKPADFKEFVKCLINERMKKLEESYHQNVIPSLEKKIALLENENKYLTERAVCLQKNLQSVIEEYRKQNQKPTQRSVGIQACPEPPPLTPLNTGSKVVSLSGKTTSAPHVVVDSIPALHKPPSSQVSPKALPTTYTMQNNVSPKAAFAQVQRVVATTSAGVRYPATVSSVASGSMYTTIAGQPRLCGDASFKPGSHPNAVVTPRVHTSFARPNGPVTATVYPQPQNIPASPTMLSVPRNSSPSSRNPGQSPPNAFAYTQQTANGVVIRSVAQAVGNPTTQAYTVTSNRHGHSLSLHSSTISPGHQIPTGPPPDYQTATGRVQQQKSYQPTPAVNPHQMTSVRQYSAIPGGALPRGGMVSAPGMPNAPRQMVVQNQTTPRAHAGYSRPNGPPPLVRAQPQPQLQPQRQQQPHQLMQPSPRFQATVQTHPIAPRGHSLQHAGNVNPSIAQVQTSPSQGRMQNSMAQVRIQGVPSANAPPAGPRGPPAGPRGPSQPSPPQNTGTTAITGRPPPAPNVSISSVTNGIVLSWNMTIPEGCAQIDSYQLFAYQNNGHVPDSPSLWKKLGIVKALPLPMACTLTQFVSGSVYHFAVRAIDIHGRPGNYSSPCAITLPSENGTSGAL